MGCSRTTTSCSAVALTLAFATAIAESRHLFPTIRAKAASKAAATPSSPFPAQTNWTAALDKALVAPPAFDAASGVFPLEGDQLAAYDLNHGALRWTASARPLTQPAVGGGLVFVEQADTLEALTADGGIVSWQHALASKLTVPLTWHDDRLAAVSGTSIQVFRATDGSPLWHRALPSPPVASPTLSGDRIYVPTSDGRVMALGAGDGQTLWERRLGGPAHAVLVVNDRLFVGSSDNFLYCLSTVSGQIEWRWQTGADVVNLPLAHQGRVYFVSLDNVLRALNQSNGVQQWKRALQFRPAWGPVKAADTLILAGIDGPPHAFTLKDGTPAGDLGTDPGAELAAQPHVFESPGRWGPTVVAVTRRLASGATVMAASRSIEPQLMPSVVPLPGVVPVTVTTVR